MIKFEQITKLSELYSISQYLKSLQILYPDIQDWFWNSVMPTIWESNSKIFFIKKDKNLIGFILLKDENEKKIRTLYILDEYRNKGYVLKIFELAMKELHTEYPKFSVPEEYIEIYKKVAKKFNYELTQIIPDKYRKNKIEYFFN